jgi:hypothetical protein
MLPAALALEVYVKTQPDWKEGGWARDYGKVRSGSCDGRREVPWAFCDPHIEHRSRSDTSGTGKLSGRLSTFTDAECPQLVSWQIAGTDRTPCSRMLPRLIGRISFPSCICIGL